VALIVVIAGVGIDYDAVSIIVDTVMSTMQLLYIRSLVGELV